MTSTASPQTRTSRCTPRLPIEAAGAPDLTTASVMLARHDNPVFPCTRTGKQPLTSHGFHDATADLATVQGWWGRWPDANIGRPTGAASGVDVVDVDVHPAGSGFAAFERARAAGHAEGWAWLVRTPSSGIHAYPALVCKFARAGLTARMRREDGLLLVTTRLGSRRLAHAGELSAS